MRGVPQYGMPELRRFAPYTITAGILTILALLVSAVSGVRARAATQAATRAAASQGATSASAATTDSTQLIAAFRRVEVASLADAMEQLLGKKMYMSHRMRPVAPSRFAGTALTVLLKKEENKEGSSALQGMLAAIDQGPPDSVYVMVVEGGIDIAGMGGLMGTAMSARGFAGAVIDGGVRDTNYLQRIGFPVYALGIVPSTSVGHYRFSGSNIPVTCDGIHVDPNDVIVADNDGVVVVPRARAEEVLKLAQELDFKEHTMYSYIEKYKSILKAVEQFGRI